MDVIMDVDEYISKANQQSCFLPKIQKPSILGRPVISSVECHTSKISKFADHYLKDFYQ